MNKVRVVCSNIGANIGAGIGIIATGAVFAFSSKPNDAAATFAVSTMGRKKIGSVVGNVLKNNPKMISIANTMYNQKKLTPSKEYIDMEE